jgi:hypothetical protein
MALRADHRRLARQGGFCRTTQLRKGPTLPGSQIAQSDLVAPVPGDLLPAFVKHLLFPKPKLASVARPISPTGATPQPTFEEIAENSY